MRIRTLLVAPIVVALLAPATAATAAPGDLDPAFSGNGIATFTLGAGTDEVAEAAAVQPDGRIVLAGERHVPGSRPDIVVARLTSAGKLDRTFSRNGWSVVDVRGAGTVGSVALQTDGSIVVVGSAYTAHDADVVVLRFTARGRLDPTFSGNGILTSSFASAQGWGEGMRALSNGKLLVVGGVEPASGTNDWFVLRLKPNGHPDGAFSGDGRRVIDFGADDWAYDVAVDGSAIVVAGYVGGPGDPGFGIARLTAAGALDTSFDGDGLASINVVAGSDDYAQALFVNADGTYLLVGPGSATDTYGLSFARFTSAGLPDASFGGGDGAVSSDPTTASDYLDATARSGTKIVAAGASVGSVTKFELARYTAAGALDTTFGGGDGIVTTRIKPYAVAYAVAVVPGTKAIVAAGRRVASDDDLAVTRYRG